MAHVRTGRVLIFCARCTRPAASVSEAALQRAANYTLWRGRNSEVLAKLITDSANVICDECETAQAHPSSAGL